MDSIAPDILDIVSRYVAALHDLGVTPTRVVLFGSHAKGTAGPFSDIDLLIISPAFAELAAVERPRILARANRALLAPIQALWTTPAAVANAAPTSLLFQVMREGVELSSTTSAAPG